MSGFKLYKIDTVSSNVVVNDDIYNQERKRIEGMTKDKVWSIFGKFIDNNEGIYTPKISIDEWKDKDVGYMAMNINNEFVPITEKEYIFSIAILKAEREYFGG